jgi:hypothetical protein
MNIGKYCVTSSVLNCKSIGSSGLIEGVPLLASE